MNSISANYLKTGNIMSRNFIILKKRGGFKILLILSSLFLLITIIIATGLGSIKVSFYESAIIIISEFFSLDTVNHVTTDANTINIIWRLRFPRVLLGGIIGASLSLSGVAMQALIRNELADPFILGVSSGGSTFAVLSMLFGFFSFFGFYSLAISAFIGSLLTIILVYYLSKINNQTNISQLLLTGVAVTMMLDGLRGAIILNAPNALGLHNATFWMSGSLAGSRWEYVFFPLIIFCVCFLILLIFHRQMDLLLIGEESARMLGMNTVIINNSLIIIASFLTAISIAVSGTIGFIGLMIPHFTRLLIGFKHKKVIPLSIIFGAILVIWVDVLARVLFAPEELPVGIVTAIVGAPIFILLLRKYHKG